MDLDQGIRAIKLLFEVMGTQKRKVSGEPVIIHSMTIFMVLREQTDDDKILIAAILHSVLRDKNSYTYTQLKADFGEGVARIVEELSEYKGEKGAEKETWKERKYRPLNGFPKMETSSQKIFLVSRAVNLVSLVSDYRAYGNSIWSKFNASEQDIAEYYRDFGDILTANFHHPLVRYYHKAYVNALKVFHWEERFFKKP